MLVHSPDILSKLKNSLVFVDTNVIIGALNNDELLALLLEVKKKDGVLLTLNSVLFEFFRGSGTVDGFNSRASFFDKLFKIWPIEKQIDQYEDAILVFQRTCPGMSYTDFLLGICVYKHRESHLITENHTHFPTNIFTRVDVFTIDSGKDIRSYGVYKLNEDGFRKAAQSILEGKDLLAEAENDIPF